MALRKLNSSELDALITYVSIEPEVNLYILGDLEAYGLERPVSVASLGSGSTWSAVVLGLHNNFVVYSQEGLDDYKVLADYIKEHADNGVPRHLNARLDIARALAPYFPDMSLDECRLATCKKLAEVNGRIMSPDIEVRVLREEDFGELVDFYNDIDESTQHNLSASEREKAVQRKIESAHNGCESIGIYKSGRLVSAASTSAAYSKGAMLTGVATLLSERGNGYASMAVEKLCADCFERGMDYICLYYNNPVAARIYKRIGFEDIAEFGMLSRRQ